MTRDNAAATAPAGDPEAALPFPPRASYIGIVRVERKSMSQKAMRRLSFFLLMGLTLYASFLGAG